VQLQTAVRGFRVGAIFLAAAFALTIAYFAIGRGAAQNDIYDATGIASSLAILLGVRLNRPDFPLPWLLFAAGNLFFAVADIIFNQLVNPPTPSVADWFYLGGYPVLAAGLVLLLIRGGGHHRVAALGEAAIVTFAFALFQWVWIVDGIIDGSGSAAGRAVNAAYPMMDVVLLAGLAGFFVTAAWRTPAFLLLVTSIVALLVSDEVYGVSNNSYRSGDWTDLGWLLSYILWAAAALHPSMRELSQPRRRRSRLRVHPVRIALLTAALLSAPFVLLVQYLRDAPLNVPAIVIAATAISVLVLMRLVGILRALERLRERERSARADAEQAQMLLAMQNDQLVEADKLKDEFVALISHDLRTPLTSIIGYVELSLEDVQPPLDEERRGYLQIVSRSSERPRAEAKQLALEFVGGSPVMIEGDKGRLFQLLDNLISNAIKFTPEGGRVEIRAVPADGVAVLEVSDTGIGLGPDESELVFDRFFRSSRVVAQQMPGTGLGLFIARAIVEAHAGTIAAGTRAGGGTTFHVELPAQVVSQPADPELVA
jgi:signal transduction histidine kinase